MSPVACRKSLRDVVIATILIVCVALAGFWQYMSRRSARPFEPFDLTAEDFGNFVPQSDDWIVRRLPLPDDPVEPNILMYSMRPASIVRTPKHPRPETVTPAHSGAAAHPDTPTRRYHETYPRVYVLRLVHGYDMVDCMRIKGFEVREISLDDARTSNAPHPTPNAQRLERASASTISTASASPDTPTQLWTLTTESGDRFFMLTSMVRAGGFAETGIDTRTMPFPKAATPDNPGWFPQGLTWRSLRHPIRNFRTFLRSQWNASRNDPATFLKLRQPDWASAELLTIVVATENHRVVPEHDAAVLAEMQAAYRFFLRELRAWRKRESGGERNHEGHEDHEGGA